MKNKDQVAKPNIKTNNNQNNTDQVKKEEVVKNTASQQTTNNNDINALKKEIEIKNQKINQLTIELNNYNANFKKEIETRAAKAQEQLNTKINEITKKSNEEVAIAKKYAIKDHAEELINIISQMNSIIKASENNPSQEVKNYVVGFKMYMNMFENLLLNMGIKKINVKVGDLFDEKIMNAVDTEKTSSVKPNCVSKIVREGYYLHDRVLIHVDVVVSK